MVAMGSNDLVILSAQRIDGLLVELGARYERKLRGFFTVSGWPYGSGLSSK